MRLPDGVAVAVARCAAEVCDMPTGARCTGVLAMVEGVLAAKLMAASLRFPVDQVQTLRDVHRHLQERVGAEVDLDGERSSMALVAESNLHGGAYSKKEIKVLLQCDDLIALFPDTSRHVVAQILTQERFFCCQSRAMRVYRESARVLQFRSSCPGNSIREESVALLGKLMAQSQKGGSQLFDRWMAGTDDMARTAQQHGSLGSRTSSMDNAVCVSLVRDADVSVVRENIGSELFEAYRLNPHHLAFPVGFR